MLALINDFYLAPSADTSSSSSIFVPSQILFRGHFPYASISFFPAHPFSRPRRFAPLCAPIDHAHLRLVPLLSLHPFPIVLPLPLPLPLLRFIHFTVWSVNYSSLVFRCLRPARRSSLFFISPSFVNSLEPNCLILRILISCPSSMHYFLSQPPFPIFSFFLRPRTATPARI